MKLLNTAMITACPQIDEPTSEEIKIARIRAKLSQEECAYLTYVTSTTWSRWETGRTLMNPLVWEAFQHKVKLLKGEA